MLIAITALENTLQSEIDPRFGRAAFYMIVNTETDEITIHNNSDGISAANGAGTGAAQTLAEYGVKALYTGNVGPKAAVVLEKAQIQYYENITGTVQGVIDQLKNGDIPQKTSKHSPAQTEGQPTLNNNPVVAPQCPGALLGTRRGTGIRAGRGQGMGRGMGRGTGRGKGIGC